MMRISIPMLAVCGVVGLMSGSTLADIPPHPEKLSFAELNFEPPNPQPYRHVLSNGVVVYMAPSSEFPLINLVLNFKGGSFLEPAGKTGLGSATGAMIRRGGSQSKTAQELDEEFDFLAAQASAFCGDTQSGASLNCLKSNFDQAFTLFMDMVRNPRFQQDRLDVFKSEVIENLKQRNDDADPILSREWKSLMYGPDHFEAVQPTKASIDSITVDDLKTMHKRIFHPVPGHLFIAVTGDFDAKQMLARLEKACEGWASGETTPEPPAPTASFTPGVYHVEKDIPQGKVFIGLRGIKRDDPDYFPLLIANHILGGGGFTSRITNRVRSDEGLAYHASSAMAPRIWYPGEFRAGFQSKNQTIALATKIVMEEISRIRSDAVSAAELDVAKNSFIETFPRTFESKAGMLAVFVSDEMTARHKDYWKTYRDKIRAVKVEDVQRVAQKYFAPDKLAIVVVGKWDEIYKGDLGGRATMKEFFNDQVTHLPLRDPLTLEPVE